MTPSPSVSVIDATAVPSGSMTSAGRSSPGTTSRLRAWVLCLYYMGLNLSNEPIAQEALYLGFFEFVHYVRRRGKPQRWSLVELLVTPRNPGGAL